MAEVIGVVSGALTFATVAAQVTKSIIQIKDCWGQIRDAPEDLQRLVKEVEIFGFILADIEADLSQDLVASALKNSNHASQSLELCKQAASDLKAVSTSLTNDISNTKGVKRTYASVKVVIKKGNIEKYRARLGSATRLLSLSQQCYTRALLQVQPELIAARILGGGENAPGQKIPQDKENSDINTITKPKYKSKPRYSQKEDYLWRLVLPPWLAGKCFEVARRRAPSGWQWNFKTYNIVPRKSQVFQLVESNNIEGLQRLFSSGQASPFDSSSTGVTLIDFACYLNCVETVTFLISQGADLESWSDHGWAWLGTFQPSFGPRLPLLRVILRPDNELSAMEDDLAWEILKKSVHCSVEEFLFLQHNVCPSFYEAAQWKRISLVKSYLGYMIYGYFSISGVYAVICTILREVSFTACPAEFESYSKFLTFYGLQQFPCIITRHIGLRMGDRGSSIHLIKDFNQCLRSFCSVLNDFLVGGFDINEVDYASCHLLVTFFEGYLNRWDSIPSRRSLNNGFQWWLKELQNLGVNLKSFGKSGERSFKLSGGPREYGCELLFPYFTHRLLGFSHGNAPEDWKLWLFEPSDAFSGDFWRMIERRMEIPGGWSSDIPLFLQ